LVFVLVFVATDCKKKTPVEGVELEVAFTDEELTDNLITDVHFTWKTTEEFVELNQEYNIFVHFWHKNNLLFQDDHTPEVPTTEWEPNKEYTSSRRIYIPTFIDEFDPDFKGEETLRVSIGFFSPYDTNEKSKKVIFDEKVKVFPPPLDTPEIIFEEGWYDLEINPDSFLKQWRWTAKEARCIVDNPHRDALLVIKGGMNTSALQDQKVIFKIDDMILDEFIPKKGYFEKSYPITKDMLGDLDEFYLKIVTDKTFVPAKLIPNSTDERELGLQISFIYFR